MTSGGGCRSSGGSGISRSPIACPRDHEATKTRGGQDRLYREAFGVLRRHLGYAPWQWCLHESAYAWRAAHGGRRAADPLSRLVCAWRAATRYARVNGASGMISALRGSG